MEELIKAKDEQIAKLNDLKELLKKQILSLQEENTKLKNDLFEIEEKIKQLPKEVSQIPDYQSMFNSINAKLTAIVEKLDIISVEGIASPANPKAPSKSKSKAINESSIKIAEPHPAEQGLLKPSSLFTDPEPVPAVQPKGPQLYQEATSQQPPLESQESSTSFHAADPRSLHRTVMEIPYPDTGIIQCPKCNGQQFQEMPEPARGSFAKKYYCKKCRQEWRFLY
jgi:uncharacterized phage infection (PIP) family protein YhgE